MCMGACMCALGCEQVTHLSPQHRPACCSRLPLPGLPAWWASVWPLSMTLQQSPGTQHSQASDPSFHTTDHSHTPLHTDRPVTLHTTDHSHTPLHRPQSPSTPQSHYRPQSHSTDRPVILHTDRPQSHSTPQTTVTLHSTVTLHTTDHSHTPLH